MRFVRYLGLIVLAAGTAVAQPEQRKPRPPHRPVLPKPPGPGGGEQEIVVGGMKIFGTDRAVRLLYFLERANEELERASLQKRSFIPQLARSIDDEKL